MRLFGLIGKPLSHSFSKDYFTRKFEREHITDAKYQNFELQSIEEFHQLIAEHPGLCGLNVTIPYKESVIPFLDEVHPVAKEIGSVNCLVIQNGKTTGYNTDIYGISETLKPHLEWYMTSALILGSGGSAKTVAYFLQKTGMEVQFVSREKAVNTLTYDELTEEIIRRNKLIINCTPVGMFPYIEQKPQIPYEGISDMHVLFDLIYNPPMTGFLHEGMEREATTLNGEKMLRIQAEASWKLWNPEPVTTPG